MCGFSWLQDTLAMFQELCYVSAAAAILFAVSVQPIPEWPGPDIPLVQILTHGMKY